MEKKIDNRKKTGADHHSFGVPKTEEVKEKLSVAQQGENGFWFGKERDQQTKDKNKKAVVDKGLNLPCIQFDKETGLEVARFDSITEAYKITKVHHMTIRDFCYGYKKGKRILGKYYWEFQKPELTYELTEPSLINFFANKKLIISLRKEDVGNFDVSSFLYKYIESLKESPEPDNEIISTLQRFFDFIEAYVISIIKNISNEENSL